MKAQTVLDSVVFQLTPTRTRYDLVITANGKMEKIASGLLDPFLAHLKSAEDQIAKGGYSIRLEPEPGTDTTWFTKDTLERFVRYVSTPEVLERVNTLELEILQINEAIAIQGNGGVCSNIGEDYQSRWDGSVKGGKSVYTGDKETTMILSKHGKHRRLSTGSIGHQENSRHQLMKVHETRKAVLRKEQGMAFARALAAGFDIDHMSNLILFAKSFGASRLLDACMWFVDLWNARHKTGQWLEVNGAEGMPFQSRFTSTNASGVIFSGDEWKEEQFNETWILSRDHLATKTDTYAAASNTEEKRRTSDLQYCHGQTQNPMLPSWASHLRSVSQSYPIHGMSYHPDYPASASAHQSPYPPIDDPGLTIKTGFKRHSINKVYGSESKTPVTELSNIISKDGVDQNDMEFKKGTSHGQKLHKRTGHSGKRQSSAAVVKKQSLSEQSDKSNSDYQSFSDVGSGNEIQDFRSDAPSRKHRKSSSTVCKDGVSMHMKASNIVDKDQVVNGQEGDSGNWQTFQKLLLRVQKESTSTVDRDMFSGDNSRPIKRLNKSQADSSITPLRNNADAQELRMVRANNEGGRSGHCMAKNDDVMICEPTKRVSCEGSSRILPQNEYQNVSNFHKSSSYNESDESFMVPFRSRLHGEAAEGHKTVMDMNSDFHPTQKNNEYFCKPKNQQSYEPHDLSIIPHRSLEKGSSAFDPAKEFDMQIPVKNGIKRETRSQEDVSKRAREGLKGLGKERKSSSAESGLEKSKMDPMTMKGKSSKLNPLADAKARAEKIRAFKADLQKAKKEKEDEERNRLEALKRERQKRISARSSLNTPNLPMVAPLTKAIKPTRNSPSSCTGSKSSNTKPLSSSTLHKTPINSKSPSKPHQISASVTPKPSPYSYKGSKFSDAQPSTTSPLVKLLRSSKNVAQSMDKAHETTVQKQTRLYPSSAPAKLPSSSKLFAQSTSKSPETAALKPTSLFSSTGSGSKFSDTVPLSSSPLQKLRTRTVSAISIDSHKITNLNRFNGSTNLVISGSGPSASSVHRLKNETNGMPLGANVVHIQAKRLSDPKGSKMRSASSASAVTNDQVQKKTMPKESHAKSKTSTLQGRIVASRESCGEVNKNAGAKDAGNETRSKTSLTSESMLDKKANEAALVLRNKVDDPIVEKAVLILENKTISAPVIRTSEQIGDMRVGSYEVIRERIELIMEHPAVTVPPPTHYFDEADISSHCKPHMQPGSCEVGNSPKDTRRKLSDSPITEEPNQALYARVLQVQESTSSEIEQIEVHVDQKIHMVGSRRTTGACHSVDSISVEQIHEVHGKPHTRGSPKGFKEILKFRRKGQSLASNELHTDTSAVNVCTATSGSSNVSTLKDLFSKENNAQRTPTKVSRPFSLFSPFQTKSSEKKQQREDHA